MTKIVFDCLSLEKHKKCFLLQVAFYENGCPKLIEEEIPLEILGDKMDEVIPVLVKTIAEMKSVFNKIDHLGDIIRGDSKL